MSRANPWPAKRIIRLAGRPQGFRVARYRDVALMNRCQRLARLGQLTVEYEDRHAVFRHIEEAA